MQRRKRRAKGFTLIEVIVTLVILAILAGLGYGTVAHLVARAEQNAEDQVARSLFMAAQSALTHVYANDQATAESLENASETVSLGLVSPAPESAEWTKELALNGDNILSLSSNAGGGTALVALLEGYVDDKAVLAHSILIEYNRLTGNVLACFYSKQTTLSHGDGGYNVYERGEAALRSGSVGVYMVEYTGSRQVRSLAERTGGLDELAVALVDYDDPGAMQGHNINGGSNYGLLTLECALPSGAPQDTVYEISINAYAGRELAGSFTLSIGPNTAVAHVAMDSIGSNMDTALHAPLGYTDGGQARGAALFIDPQRDQNGRQVLVLVLDSQVEGAGIHELYAELAGGELMATVSAESVSGGAVYRATSNSAHALYAAVDANGLASVAGIRHLNNLRYTPDGNFVQTRDIAVVDYTGRAWPMAPLGDALVSDGVFGGSYDGGDYAIQGLTMPAGTQNAGLFRAIAGSGSVRRVHLLESEMTGTLRAGGITAENRGFISACTVCHAADKANAKGLTISATGTGALAGGIAAENSGTISGCAVYHRAETEDTKGLAISATGAGARAGGIAARNRGTLTACTVNDADLSGAKLYITATGTGAAADGIVAENNGVVSDCLAGKNVEAKSLPGTAAMGLSGRTGTGGAQMALLRLALYHSRTHTTATGMAG